MSKTYLQSMQESSHLSGASAGYVDALYEAYLQDAASVPQEWQRYFQNLPETGSDISHQSIRDYFLNYAKQSHAGISAASSSEPLKQAHVVQLINAYRTHGHHLANLDPLLLTQRKTVPDLDPEFYGFGPADLDRMFSTESPLTRNGTTLRDIINALQQTYTQNLGFEFMHITDNEQTSWLIDRIESVHAQPKFSIEQKKQILQHLTYAEGLEKYLGSRFVGQKRFSLEGGDSLIPLMHELIARTSSQGVKEIVVGMAHRGRLNVLINVLGKAPEELFQEFEGNVHSGNKSGDVKYHMGFSADVKTDHGLLHLALAFNPSHLEIINPVVEGSVRSRQRRRHDIEKKEQVIPVLIHGDAAFAGQGVVMETFNFSQARGYSTGGSLHIVINNQIGFTTSNPLDSRSTLYCTDVAKMVQAPIIHVNGDDPEAVVFALQTAIDFRMTFKRDVVIDLVCYRRHGHNEADEPSITQPIMYQSIKKLETPRKIYADQLVQEGVLSQQEAEGMVFNYRDMLDKGEPVIDTVKGRFEDEYLVDWSKYQDTRWDEKTDTTISKSSVERLGERITVVPDKFNIHPVVKKLLGNRNEMTAGELPMNWGYAEIMAYASLVDDGYLVRLSGQDSGRGTFTHRHAVLHDYQDASVHIPLQHVSRDQSQFIVIDSILSEEAVLGFEYGFATAEPNALVIWEAQFGDFANGAQVVIDQFISSGEQKWGRLCGLVMLLPHGFEGQGPEHSSARLERYLQLCAQHNMQVCVPTTPAQIFHMLRRQMIRPFKKPLIVMTPKSLLRHKLAVSPLEDLSSGKFYCVIPEVDDLPKNKIKRIVLCSGKVYYDLLQKRRAEKIEDVAIFRIEQLYPFPKADLIALLQEHKHVNDIVWCQEEPQNQGAWYSSRHNMESCLQAKQKLIYVGRSDFAAPAVGHFPLHVQQQNALVAEALLITDMPKSK